MGAMIFRARCELRSGWRSWVGLALVVGLAVRVVGVVAVPGRFPPQDAHTYLGDPWVYLTPAFYHRYNDRLLGLDLLAVQVKPGQGAAFDKAASVGADGRPVPDEVLAAQANAVQHGFGLQAVALGVLASLAALSTVLIV